MACLTTSNVACDASTSNIPSVGRKKKPTRAATILPTSGSTDTYVSESVADRRSCDSRPTPPARATCRSEQSFRRVPRYVLVRSRETPCDRSMQQTGVCPGFFSFFSQTLLSTSLHFTPPFLTFYLRALALHSVSVYFAVRRPSDQVTKSKHAPPSPLACFASLACSPPLVTLRMHSPYVAHTRILLSLSPFPFVIMPVACLHFPALKFARPTRTEEQKCIIVHQPARKQWRRAAVDAGSESKSYGATTASQPAAVENERGVPIAITSAPPQATAAAAVETEAASESAVSLFSSRQCQPSLGLVALRLSVCRRTSVC